MSVARLTWLVLLALAPNAEAGAGPTALETGASSRFFVASDGVRLHYLQAGSGHTLVFVPGWTMPAEIWAAQLRRFAHDYRVVALDPRSQGDSEIAPAGHDAERRASDIKELLDALAVDRVVLIGWSLAVLESLTYVRRHGTRRIAGLVLVDNSIGEEPPPSFDPTFLERLVSDREATTEGFVRGMYRQTRDEEYYRYIVQRSLKTPIEAAVALLSNREPRRVWREIVYGIDRPLLYAVSPRFGEQALNLKRNKPGVEIEIFEHAGHALFVDEAERFNALLERFVHESFARPERQRP